MTESSICLHSYFTLVSNRSFASKGCVKCMGERHKFFKSKFIHSDVLTYRSRCPQCEYHGKNLSKLIEHIRIHTGERPFQCDQCSYAAKRKDNLAQHKSVKHDKSRNKGPTRVLKLSSQDKPDSAQTAEPVTTHSDYASILYGRNAIGHKDWPYLKSSKNAERFPCFPGDLYAKLRNLPFDGHLPFAGVITGKTGLNFSPNFVNLSPSVQHPSHNNLSSTTTMWNICVPTNSFLYTALRNKCLKMRFTSTPLLLIRHHSFHDTYLSPTHQIESTQVPIIVQRLTGRLRTR